MAIFWTQLVLGIWILISPWILGFSDITLMKCSNLVVGLIIILVNFWKIFGKEEKSPAGGEDPQTH